MEYMVGAFEGNGKGKSKGYKGTAAGRGGGDVGEGQCLFYEGNGTCHAPYSGFDCPTVKDWGGSDYCPFVFVHSYMCAHYFFSAD